jgi:class 3 adenylate cyclase/tetratricopeptide (TPR) repeat protein
MVMPEDNNLAQLLNSLGLAMHAQAFEDNDVTLEVLRYLSDADLKELGLSLGHRRILLDAVSHAGGKKTRRRAWNASPEKLEPGERRQITVMFCDLVGSTEMSERLDLDDLQSLIHAYYSSCCNIIEDAGGFIARLVGDGILAYFGYPSAREDAAECATRASLKILEALGSARLSGTSHVNVRIGLATGMSVISDMVGSGFAERHAATGLAPNLASRIQEVATAGSVVVADDTRRLAGGLFIYADMGLHHLQGLEKPVHLWRVLGESPSSVRFDAYRTEIFECVGRDAELDTVLESWKLARLGQCRIVTVSGEAGIGKSRLLRTASERLARSSGLSVLLQCSPNQTTTPLHPLIAWIRREADIGASNGSEDRGHIAAWLGGGATPLELALIADVLGVPVSGAEALPPMPPDRKRNLTREVLLRHFERHCESAAVLFMLEDAHWMDGATEDFLRSLFLRMRDRPFMALITTRPPEKRNWRDAAAVTEIHLEPLKDNDAEKLIHNVCHGKSLPPAVVSLILAKTDGIPLFIEELTASVLESGLLHDDSRSLAMDGPLPSLDIPSTLRDSLMARLDRLNGAKDVARVASALGREFSFSLLLRVTGQSPARLAAALDRLVEAQLLFRRGAPPADEYVFKHALIQQAAYEGQLRSDRQALHARILHTIETHHPEMASHEPGLMAHHCQEANLPDKEVDYLYAAGLASTRMVAIAEALSHFSRAEKVVAGLPQTPHRIRRHIDIILGMMEVGRFAILPKRLMELGALAKSLSQVEGVTCDAATMSAILFQEGRAHLYSSRYSEARRIFTEIRQLGREKGSPQIEMKPASALSMNLCCQGLFNETLEFINESNVGRYKAAGSSIDYISGLGWIGYATCQMGAGDEGLRFGDMSVQEAENVQSPVYLGGAHIWRSHALMAVRRLEEAVDEARRCVTLSQLHSVPYLGWHGLVFLSLCLCRASKLDEAAASLGEARVLLAKVADGHWSLLDYIPAIEAEMACFRGDHVRAVAAANQAIEVAQAVGGYFAESIAWRVKALSSVRTGGDPLQAQVLFDNAVRLFERGGARAEQAFSTLVWSHALHLSGHAERARQAAHAAVEQARRHRLSLARCEYGAWAML